MLLPTGKKTIGRRWVFAINFNLNRTVARLKARLVAKGCKAMIGTCGVDYSYTFSPVTKLTSLFISFAASYD